MGSAHGRGRGSRRRARRASAGPDLVVEHIGSTAVPGLPGKGIVDLSIETDPRGHPGRRRDALRARVRPAAGPGSVAADPADAGRLARARRRRATGSTSTSSRSAATSPATSPSATPSATTRSCARQYEGLKRGITERRRGRGPPLHALEDAPGSSASTGSSASRRRRSRRRDDRHPRRRPARPDARRSPARELGYRIAVLDPDPRAPGRRDRGSARGRHATTTSPRRSAWPRGARSITYELEHVGPAVVAALDDRQRPDPAGPVPAQAHRRPSRRAALRRGQRGPRRGVARGRRARPTSSGRRGARLPAPAQGDPRRLRRPRPGPPRRHRRRSRRLDGRIGWPALLERELAFEAELSVVVARNVDGIEPDVPGRAEPARPRDPRRDRRPGRRPAGGRAGRGEPRREPRDLDGPRRHAHGRAVPHARRLARRQRARAAGPQQRPLVDRGRGHEPVRAAPPRDLRPAARLGGDAGAGGGDGQPARRGRAAAGPPDRASTRRSSVPDAHVHLYDKATGLRAAEDGPRDGARRDRRRGARPGPRGRRRTSAGRRLAGRRPSSDATA